MQIVWSSVPDAALAIWTPAVIEDGAPFTLHRDWLPPEQRVLRVCSACARGILADGRDWAATFAAITCHQCESREAA
jgi:hypothetical protein